MIIDQSSILAEDGQQLFIVGDESDETAALATAQPQYQILHDGGSDQSEGLLLLNGNGEVDGGAVYYMPATAAADGSQLLEAAGGQHQSGGQVLAAMSEDGTGLYCKSEVRELVNYRYRYCMPLPYAVTLYHYRNETVTAWAPQPVEPMS